MRNSNAITNIRKETHKNTRAMTCVVALLFLCMHDVTAQEQRRQHTTTQTDGEVQLQKSRSQAYTNAEVSIKIEVDVRVIRANGLPDHKHGSFPNSGNPHEVSKQSHVFKVPAKPQQAERVTDLGLGKFGVAVNGIPFDPGAAEFYLGNRNSAWRYEALSGAVRLGIDESHAHVQPSGSYHYHGLPTALMKDLKVNKSRHSPIIGWAMDGFPIYALYGYADAKDPNSKVIELKSGYQLKTGKRPSAASEPGGTYDGTFVNDYRHVAMDGVLDACNGRFCITPDFPEGTYAYFLTSDWPVIPRQFRGTPSQTQKQGRGERQEHGHEHEQGGDHGHKHRRPPPPDHDHLRPPPRRH